MLINKLLATQKPSEAEEPEGVSFDGVTDYLSRSTDLVGNVDSKTFTFSCWVYGADRSNHLPLYSFPNGRVQIQITTSGVISIKLYNASGVTIVEGNTSLDGFTYKTFLCLMISIDTTSTLKRHVYLGDLDITSKFSWTTYTNADIDFTYTTHEVARYTAARYAKGRLSDVFLDYVYRDLSIEANRRLFITADGKPADGQASLNPILYLPMKDAATAHINEGTGGNFVQNGVLDTASRGANQDNCVASYFDGVNDSLDNLSFSTTDDNLILINGVITRKVIAQASIIRGENTAGSTRGFRVLLQGDGKVKVNLYNSVSSQICEIISTDIIPVGATYSYSFSMNTTTSDFEVVLNGVVQTIIPEINSTNSIGFASIDYIRIAKEGTSTYDEVSIGEIYLDTPASYIDLATNNPFWDSDTKKPIPVRKAMETLGSTPLICMPIDASNAGKDYGTSGDFTANSAPFVGARGASEYISRSIVVDTTKYLTGSIFCQSLVKWKSIDAGVTWTVTYLNATTVTNIGNGTDNGVVSYYFGFSDNINWTLEENKNMVTDQLGYPKEPASVIKNSGWSPVLGLFFTDTANFGLNMYGADFTQTGVITAGADVK